MRLPALTTLRRGSTAEALLHFVVLLVLFLLLTVLLDFAVGGVSSIAVAVAYVFWIARSERPEKAATGTRLRARAALKESLARLPRLALSLSAVVVTILVFVFIAYLFAYELGATWKWLIDRRFLSFLLLAVLVALILLWAGVFLRLMVRQERPGPQPAWWQAGRHWRAIMFGEALPGASILVSLVALLTFTWAGVGFRHIATNANYSWAGHVHTTLVAFPALLACLLGPAVALASRRGLYRSHKGLVSGTAPLVMLLIGAAATAYGMGTIMGLALVGAASAVPAMGYAFAAAKAIDDWVEKSVDEGVGIEALAAALNANGYWESERPEQGLAELLPDLGDTFSDLDEILILCTMRLAAGGLLPEERSALAEDSLPLKYCLAVSCRTPDLVREENAATWLLSSHPSTNEGWARFVTTTILFDEIGAPGGFCTTTGELAARYQG